MRTGRRTKSGRQPNKSPKLGGVLPTGRTMPSERVEELPHNSLRQRYSDRAVAARPNLLVLWHVEGAEEPIDHRQVRDVILVDCFVVARMMPVVVTRRGQHVFEGAKVPTNIGVDQSGLEPGKNDVDGERLLGNAEDEGGNQQQGPHHERFQKM